MSDEPVRLQKWLAELGLASRREAEEWIKSGRLKINEKVATLGAKVSPGQDKVEMDSKVLGSSLAPKVYWMLHKPDKTLSSRAKQGEKPRIYDLPKLKSSNFHIFSVGRLDFRTEGLLLLTNDGDLCNRLCHPKYKLPRYYQVLINGKLDGQALSKIRSGVKLGDGEVKCQVTPAYGVNLGKSKGTWYFVTVFEGRNRLVRRIFEHFELKVVRLIRYGFGDLRLDSSLKPGSIRQLKSSEIKHLKNSGEINGHKNCLDTRAARR